MSLKALTVLSWSLWGVLALGVAVVSAMLLTERRHSPELGREASVGLVVILVALLAAAGLILHLLARKQSFAGLVIVSLFFASPLVLILARQAKFSLVTWLARREFARIGAHSDPVAAPMARAILADDAPALALLLRSHSPPPAVRDRAGLDLVALACVAMVQSKASAEPLRILLDAGADPAASRLPEDLPLVGFLVLNADRAPHAADGLTLLLAHGLDPNTPLPRSGDLPLALAARHLDLVRILLDHGADPDRLDGNGDSLVVRFIGTQAWDAALLLIERGAALDHVSSAGTSVDYYLREWRNGVHGEPSPEWDRVRAAIDRRRQPVPPSP
ncbi:MAG: ankyrin repeat domain-containing protein [Verrucomicrobiae bacterium]|nr:ankyrin repeat domain-containing protein [Verrucomicrobiae bacterium]